MALASTWANKPLRLWITWVDSRRWTSLKGSGTALVVILAMPGTLRSAPKGWSGCADLLAQAHACEFAPQRAAVAW